MENNLSKIQVSIVIGSYNQKEKLKKVIESYCFQTFPNDLYELIVVDSTSSDGTREWSKSQNLAYYFRFYEVENKGKSYARNYGIQKANGKIIILSDADIVADKDFVKNHYDAHVNTDFSMCYEGLEYNLKDISKPINKSNIARYIKINTKNNQKLGWYYFLTGNLSAPRDILINNLFSEDFLGYGWEDLELGYRLYKKGIQLRYLKSAVNYHYHSYGFYEELERKEKMGFEAAIFIKKHPELKNWLGFHPLLMFIYKMLKNNGVSIKLLNSLSKKKGIGRAAKYVLSEYYYRHGYYLCQKFGQRKKIFSNNKIKYDVSVIITTYNNKNVLEKCLDSIYKYTKDINFEIIVVDNHSQDGTIFLVEKKYPTIKYIYLEDNYGFAKANNIGIMESCSKYILLLNNDTLLFNNLIKDLHDFMEKDQNNSACGPRLVDEKLRFQKQGSILFNLYLRIINKAVNVNFLPMTAFFIRKSVFDKIGLLDENFFFYNEDLDFALRMKKSDLVIRYIPSASLIHTGKGTAKYLPEKVIFESYKGGLYFVKKHYNRLIYIIYSIFVLFEINIKILYKKLEFKKNNREITELRKAKKLIFN